MNARLLIITGLLMASAPSPRAQLLPAADGVALASYRSARTIVSRALDAVGGADAIDRAGGLALDGEGELDLGTLLQGRRPFEGDAHPIIERIALLPKAGRLVHEERAPINPDALSWQRTDYRPEGTYRIDLGAREATWARPMSPARIERMIPHLLLEEVLANPASLRHMGQVTLAGETRDAVVWHLPERAHMTLLFDPRTHLLREVETLADLPVRGDATIRWTFLEHTRVPGLGLFPTGYTIHVDDERLREIRWTRRAAAPTGGILDAPDGVDLPAATPFEAPQGTGPAAGGNAGNRADRPEFDIRDLAPGVHLLANLRTGFHMLFVEFDDFVAAVDAPSGWWELQELPARDWARSASPALGERYVRAIRSRVGDKPIRYVVLTHHHSDHVGGVRAFVEAGATVVGTPLTRTVADRTLAGSLSLAGRDEAPAPKLHFDVVEGDMTMRGGEMEMRIIDVGANPHSEGMLAVWLPGPKILYVSDLFDPWSTRGSPPRDRLPVMRWFVQWLDRSGLEPERIYAIHGSALVRPENLEEIRRGMAGNAERAEQAPSRAATVVAESRWFTFHSDPRVNLHDFLVWRASSEERVEPRESCVSALPAAQGTGLAEAELHYRRTIGDRSPGHDRLMLALRFHLVGTPNEIVPRTDQHPTLEHIEAALPAYLACWWPDHDRRNREWIADVVPRLARHGSAIAGRLAQAFVAEWSWPIDVDTVSYAGGANTVLRPTHVLITSRDPAYRGNGALEMLFHEASHSVVTPRSGRAAEAIRSAQSSLGVQPPRDLWHVLLFYTSGLVTQRQLALAGHDYELYMVREGLWNRAWPALRTPVETHWTAYLDDLMSMDEAVRRIVATAAGRTPDLTRREMR